MANNWDDFPRLGKSEVPLVRVDSSKGAVFRDFGRLARALYRTGQTAAGRNRFREEKMVDMSKIGETVAAVAGALVLTATAVGTAVGPATTAQAAPISLVAAAVSGQASA
jgi:hypothetical protein